MQEFKIGDIQMQLESHPLIWMPTKYASFLGNILLSKFSDGLKGLELGLGSGVLAILAGKLGLSVTALEINQASIVTSLKNWELNGLEQSNADFRASDLFSGLSEKDESSFDIFWSNPPTFPANASDRVNRKDKYEFEFAGESGREMLDSIIIESQKFLKPGGKAIFLCTSRQDLTDVKEQLNKNWTTWKIIDEVYLPLAEHYFPYINEWTAESSQDQEPKIFKANEVWHEKLVAIECIKS